MTPLSEGRSGAIRCCHCSWDSYFLSVLRAFLCLFISVAALTTAAPAHAASEAIGGRVKKVLPHLLDRNGHHTASPSLFDRDAYQAYLRRNPDQVSGIRYDVQWKARRAEGRKLTVRVELRGLYDGKVPRETTLEETYDGRSSIREWTGLELTGKAYAEFGKITAWRATLWSGEEMLDEYTSFLW
jgi:hypothetical protein